MASLSEQIDRFSRSTKAIKATAAQTALPGGRFKFSDIGVAGPFTRAVLDTHLGDLIRDIDPSELGLFQILNSPSTVEKGAPRPPLSGLARIEFGNATPLRRTVAKRDELTKLNIEPEIYAHAAIKYIDRYYPIRPMPRTRSQADAILQQLGDVRQNIRSLLQSLERVNCEDAQPLKLLSEREERLASEIRAEVANLTQRRRVALVRQKNAERCSSTLKTSETKLVHSAPCRDGLDSVSAARTLHFADTVPDEATDLYHFADMSTADYHHSTSTEVENVLHCNVAPHTTDSQQTEEGRPIGVKKHIVQKEHIISHAASVEVSAQGSALLANRPTLQVGPDRLRSPRLGAPESPVASNSGIQTDEDLERIATKIWKTVPDIIVPFRQSGNRGNETDEMPSPRETLTRLDLLSQFEVTQASASATTIATTQPTSQQILTAYLLITLLSEPPHYSVSLNKVKELLLAKMGGDTACIGVQSTSRIIYGCVAKRLVKIDRSGREQIVKLDV